MLKAIVLVTLVPMLSTLIGYNAVKQGDEGDPTKKSSMDSTSLSTLREPAPETPMGSEYEPSDLLLEQLRESEGRVKQFEKKFKADMKKGLAAQLDPSLLASDRSGNKAMERLSGGSELLSMSTPNVDSATKTSAAVYDPSNPAAFAATGFSMTANAGAQGLVLAFDLMMDWHFNAQFGVGISNPEMNSVPIPAHVPAPSPTSGPLSGGTTVQMKLADPRIIQTTYDSAISGFALDDWGRVWGWGGLIPSFGTMASMSGSSVMRPMGVPNGVKITQIDGDEGLFGLSIQETAVAALDTNGNAWVLGSNAFSQHGNGTRSEYFNMSSATQEQAEDHVNSRMNFSPVNMPAGVNFKQIESGLAIMLAVDEDGRLWGWGNALGLGMDLGIDLDSGTPPDLDDPAFIASLPSWVSVIDFGGGKALMVTEPVLIDTLAGIEVKDISSNGGETLIADVDGNVWRWGSEYSVGVSISSCNISPTPTVSEIILPSLAPLALTEKVERVYTQGVGLYSAVTDEGKLWNWGCGTTPADGRAPNFDVSEGHPAFSLMSTPSEVVHPDGLKWVDSKAGFSNALALDEAGDLWGWGFNFAGEVQTGGNWLYDNALAQTQGLPAF